MDDAAKGHTPGDEVAENLAEHQGVRLLGERVEEISDRMDKAAQAIGALTRPSEDYTEHPIDLIGWAEATPGLLAALCKAQAKIQTVGKDGENTDADYKYATADAMIREARRAREGLGLGLVTTWDRRIVSTYKPRGVDSGRWHCAEVTLNWILFHEAGGSIRGTIRADAFATSRTPLDKAVAAAATYCEGFLERGLMRIDRAVEDPHDVDARSEPTEATTQSGQQAEPKKTRTTKPPDDPEIDSLAQKARDAIEEHRTVTGEDVAALELLKRATGKAWPKKPKAAHYRAAIDGIEKEIQQAQGGPASHDGDQGAIPGA